MEESKQLGQVGPKVFPIGLGCMGMSGMYGTTDDAESIRAIHAAIDGGVTLIDTGDFYGMGHNELLIGRALRELGPGSRERVVLSVKFGALRTPGGAWGGFDGRPAAVKNFLAQSLVRLGVAQVDIYRPARLDDKIPIEDTIGAVADMIRQGYVKQAGLSEVNAETARRAQAVTPITDVQLEYGLTTRNMEESVLPGLQSLGIGTTAYGVIGRGLLSGAKPVEKNDFRRFLPRFTGANLMKNETLRAALNDFAARQRGDSGAGRDRLGLDPRRNDCAHPGHANCRAGHRSARCFAGEVERRRNGYARSGGAGERGGRHAL